MTVKLKSLSKEIPKFRSDEDLEAFLDQDISDYLEREQFSSVRFRFGSKKHSNSIVEIEGVGDVYAKELAQIGVKTVQELLKRGNTPKGRKELEEATGIGPSLILQWVNYADLFRIKGVAGQYSELLEASGVDTVLELSKRKPENLQLKMLEVNAERNLVNRPPSLKMVLDWITQAKSLGRGIHY